MVYRSPERSPQDSRDGFFLVQCPGLIFLAARCSWSFWIISFEFLKVCWIRFYLGKLHWFLYLLLFYFYDPGMFIFRWSSNFVGKVVLKGSMAAKTPTLYITIVYRVNLNKLSRNFAWALRTTTTNCRVSFTDFYSVFSRNFRIEFLPHTNTVILLEPYCGTIT